MARVVLGHVDCPTCGTPKGMRITHDKNGEPFGYCEAKCNQQIRIGGDKYRVELFLIRHPWARGGNPPPIAEPPPEKKGGGIPEGPGKPDLSEIPPKKEEKKESTWADLMGVGNG